LGATAVWKKKKKAQNTEKFIPVRETGGEGERAKGV